MDVQTSVLTVNKCEIDNGKIATVCRLILDMPSVQIHVYFIETFDPPILVVLLFSRCMLGKCMIASILITYALL